MEHLPWLVVHGAAAFWAALAVASWLGVTLAAIGPRLVAKRAARRALAALGPAADPGALEEGATVTVAGRLAEGLTVIAGIAGEVSFELAGEVVIVVGSREAPGEPTALRSIAVGELVRARGVLRSEPAADEGTTYRHDRRRWTLVPEPGGAIPVAFEGEPALAPPPWWQLTRGAGAGALAFVAALSVAGEAAFHTADGPAGASLIAAMSPLHRARALDALGTALALGRLDDYGRGILERSVALAELRGDCVEAATILLRRGQLERASAVAERCGELRLAARAHYLRGRFDLASADLERDHLGARDRAPYAGESVDAIFAARVHLFAGRVDLAREVAQDARRIAPDPRTARLACLAAVLDPGAAAPADDLACRRLAAVLAQPASCEPGGAASDLEWALCLEARLSSGDAALLSDLCATARRDDPPALASPILLFGSPAGAGTMGPPALARHLIELVDAAQPAGRCVLRGQLAASLAAFASLAGDHREARRLAELADTDLGRKGDRGVHALALRVAVELRAGDVNQARALLAALGPGADDARELAWIADVRAGGTRALVAAPQDQLGTMLHDPSDVASWALTAQGDGARLAAWLERHDAEGASLLVAAPHLERGRGELATWLRWGDKAECWACAPWLTLFDAESRASAAAALDDGALAGELRLTVEALHRALLAREIAVPAAVLEGL